jgi:hypothetical protein
MSNDLASRPNTAESLQSDYQDTTARMGVCMENDAADDLDRRARQRL